MSFFSAKLNSQNYKFVISKLSKYQTMATHPTIAHVFVYNSNRITIYKTNKILIQGPTAEQLAQELGLIANIKKHQPNKPSSNLSEYIGSDEVGVGDYFGGLVVCSAYVNPEIVSKLERLGVCDSKKLNDSEIEVIYSKLKQFIKYEVKALLPNEYNNFIKDYNNTHIAKAFLHNEAIASLKTKIGNPDCQVVLDQFVAEKNYYDYFRKLNTKPEKISIFCTQAESKYIGVAAASIIARHYFLDQIRFLESKAKLSIPLGSSSPKVITVARKIPRDQLTSFVKIDFNTTKKL